MKETIENLALVLMELIFNKKSNNRLFSKDNCGIPPEKLKVPLEERKLLKRNFCCTPESGC
jgi:hypothetical protein